MEWEKAVSYTHLLFEMTAKYGTPYFSNYVNSDMEPSDIRSMCCRLRLDLRELRKKSGGFFGSGESTGCLLYTSKPFSGTLTWCIRIIGALFVLASLVIPRLDGYQPSDFRILSSGDFVLIDGSILIFGLLLIILGNIVMAGFSMQKEMNEIL